MRFWVQFWPEPRQAKGLWQLALLPGCCSEDRCALQQASHPSCPPAGWPAALPGHRVPWSSPRSTPTQPLKRLTAAKESQAFSFTGWTAQALGESSKARPPWIPDSGTSWQQAHRGYRSPAPVPATQGPTAQNKSEIQAPPWGLSFQDCETSHRGQHPA